MILAGPYNFFCGVDPGHTGAFGLINAAATTVKVWKMPNRVDNKSELDLDALYAIFKYLKRLPGLIVGIEWPIAFPGSFNSNPRDAENFGRQKATLEVLCWMLDLDYHRISPVGWKGKLALDGKTYAGANQRAAELWDSSYPLWSSEVRGPRGGLLDGPLDALLIAHYMRIISGAAAASAPRGSAEHMAAVLSMGPGRRKRCRGLKL